MLKFSLLITSFVLLNVGSLYSQILNVEESRLKADSVNQFYGSLKFQFQIHNHSATQDEKIIYTGISLTSRFGYLSNLHNYLLLSDLKYNSVTGQPFIRTGYSHFRINWYRERPLSYESFAQVQFDLGRGLNLRWLVGSGIRIKLFDQENFQLYFGPGIMYELERWEESGEQQEIIKKDLIKSTNYLSYSQKLTETASFKLITYFQTGFDDEANSWRQRYSLDSGLKFNLSEIMSFVVEFSWSYEPRPILPIVQHVYELENGILINF